MAKFDLFKWKRDPDVPPIRDDRSLLDALHMTDAEAASFLGKSRQALNNQLGPKKGPPGTAPLDYFKLADILVLISSARATGRQFDPVRVGDYVERTRKPSAEETNVPFKVIKMLLGNPSPLNTEGANTVIFMLPAFVELRSQRPDAAEELSRVAKDLRAGNPETEIFIFSSTAMQAEMAAKWLELYTEKNSFGRDIVDHYLPTVLAYWREEDKAIPYVLTENGLFVEAAHYRGAMMAECLRSLLPDEVSRTLRPYDEEEPGGLDVAV